MNVKVFSILGAGNYLKTKYKYKNFEYETSFFLDFLTRYLQSENIVIEKTYLFATDIAKEKNYSNIENIVNYEFLTSNDIQDYENFVTLASRVEKKVSFGENIILDITHGFRSSSFTIISLVEYLAKIKGINLIGIYYGEFSEKKEVQEVRQLLSHYNFTQLAIEVEKYTTTLEYKGLIKQLLIHSKNKEVEQICNNIKSVTEALRLCRIEEIGGVVMTLTKSIEEYEAAHDSYIKTFLNTVSCKLHPLTQNGFDKLEVIVKVCYEHSMYQQMITFLLDGLIYEISNEMNITNYYKSKNVYMLSQFIKKTILRPDEIQENISDYLKYIGNKAKESSVSIQIQEKLNNNKLQKFISELDKFRNDINHAGVKSNISYNTGEILNIINSFKVKGIEIINKLKNVKLQIEEIDNFNDQLELLKKKMNTS